MKYIISILIGLIAGAANAQSADSTKDSVVLLEPIRVFCKVDSKIACG